MEPKNNQHNKNIGRIGEDLAVNHLKKIGFSILARNYLKKWGEIDVIASKADRIHFVEVKTVSYETRNYLNNAVSHGTWRPEENVHFKKMQRLSRTIETWLSENNCEKEWQIDVVAIRIVPRETFATIKIIDNIIID